MNIIFLTCNTPLETYLHQSDPPPPSPNQTIIGQSTAYFLLWKPFCSHTMLIILATVYTLFCVETSMRVTLKWTDEHIARTQSYKLTEEIQILFFLLLPMLL